MEQVDLPQNRWAQAKSTDKKKKKKSTSGREKRVNINQNAIPSL